MAVLAYQVAGRICRKLLEVPLQEQSKDPGSLGVLWCPRFLLPVREVAEPEQVMQTMLTVGSMPCSGFMKLFHQ